MSIPFHRPLSAPALAGQTQAWSLTLRVNVIRSGVCAHSEAQLKYPLLNLVGTAELGPRVARPADGHNMAEYEP